MGKYFGTDGFRGEAGVSLTAEHSFKIGRYLGFHLRKSKNSQKPRVVIGKDTRLSSYMLEYAMASGFAASGSDVYLMHVTTTPSVSYVTKNGGFDLGIMITASHNPFSDNGIKIMESDGGKMSDSLANLVEEYLDSDELCSALPFTSNADIGRIYDYYAGRNAYIGHLISSATRSYKRFKIGLDAANGSAFAISRSVFSALGAEVSAIGADPNGLNVNEGYGSTHPEALSRLVKEEGLDIGFAFDGDADRCIAVDSQGDIVDGDAILYVLANRFKRLGMLKNDTAVATVASNFGLLESLTSLGIRLLMTGVGDRFVAEKMKESGAVLGGEQSGHIIMSDYLGTGDGILTALMICEEMRDTKMSLRELTKGLIRYPQRSLNVRVKDKASAIKDTRVMESIASASSLISGKGRVLVRESGTEPVIRILAEAADLSLCDKCISEIVSALAFGGYIDG